MLALSRLRKRRHVAALQRCRTAPKLSVSKMNVFRLTPSLNVLRKCSTPKNPCFIVSAFCRILKAESIIHFSSRM